MRRDYLERSPYPTLLDGVRYEINIEPDWTAEGEPLRNDTLRIWNEIWNRFFGDTALDPKRRLALQFYAISALTGLATLRKFEGPNAEQRRMELGFLKDTLVQQLSG